MTDLAGDGTLSRADRDVDAAIAALVAASGRSPVGIDAVWAAAVDADPFLATAVDRRSRLAAALARLEAAGLIKVPKSGLDRSRLPPLPPRIRTAAPAPQRQSSPAVLPPDLRPELAGARDLNLRPDEVGVLIRVSAFLRDWDPSRPALPVRERSYELFGDEKRLDDLAKQRLFTAGVVSFDLLRCFEVHPPFVFERVGPGGVVLVVENHHTFDSVVRSLRARPRGVDVVVYGAGNLFSSSASYLVDLAPPAAFVWYFGDLDAEGLRIPARASATSLAAGGVAVRPAGLLYDELFEAASPSAGSSACATTVAEDLSGWLPARHQGSAGSILAAGERLAQEAVSFERIDALTTLVAPT